MKKLLLFLAVASVLALSSCSAYHSRMSYEDLWYEAYSLCDEYIYFSDIEDAMSSLSLFVDNDPYVTRRDAILAYNEVEEFISDLQKDLRDLQRELEENKP